MGHVYSIRRFPEVDAWRASLKDRVARIRLSRRLETAQRGPVLIVMLGGGDKSTQNKGIVAAKKLAVTIED